MKKIYSIIMTLGAFIVVVDQWSKQWALDHLKVLGETRPVFSWWSWTLVHNKGLAFGVFNNSDPQSAARNLQAWILLFLPFIVLALLWYFHVRKFKSNELFRPLTMGLVLGGAIGNFIDRLRFGYVIDFIDWFYPGSWGCLRPLFYELGGRCHWPVFNVADAAVSTALVFILIDSFKNPDGEKSPKKKKKTKKKKG